MDNMDNSNSTYFKDQSKRNIRSDILNILDDNSEGLNVSQIADTLKLSRNTVKKYLGRLEIENLIEVSEIGRSRISFLKKKRKTEHERFNSLTVIFFNQLFPAFEKVGPKFLDDHFELMKQIGYKIGREVGLSGRSQSIILSFEPKDFKTGSKMSNLANIALDELNYLNSGGLGVIGEIISVDNDDPKGKILLKASSKWLESLYHFYAGFYEANLQAVFGRKAYMNVKEYNKDEMYSIYELGFK